MKGYKGFNADLTCRNSFQYQVGQIYSMDASMIQLCRTGFHFCQYPSDVLKYYGAYDHNDHHSHNAVFARVTALDLVISDSDKSVTNMIRIDELISRQQLLLEMPTQIQRNNGDKEWYLEGLLHRLDGPAIEYSNGTNYWYRQGQLHREHGPAIECCNGAKYWYSNGILHRENGPAVIDVSGKKAWYLYGFLHRDDGPAIEFPNGDKYWYLRGLKQLENFS